MPKRRTKKQKRQAKHQFKLQKRVDTDNTITWTGKAKSRSKKTSVKGENKKRSRHRSGLSQGQESTVYLAKAGSLGTIKKDIIKTLILASLILGVELMLYWAWL